MTPRLKLPIGVDLFEKLRQSDYYYVDKSLFIKELLDNRGEVNLFTRPRRFGKTLNMSMLKEFFEIGMDPKLFANLEISREEELCEKYMSRYPVIFLTLKGVDGLSYQEACAKLRYIVGMEASRFCFLAESVQLTEADKSRYRALIEVNGKGQFAMEDDVMQESLRTLSGLLAKHFGRKVILLIDEYDVPLDKANDRGYYEQMVMFLRGFFGGAFKTNPDLFFAVVTGCLRISKESIFTGVNNLKVDTISDERYDEFFGFTDRDVKKLLADYGVPEAYPEMKEWYDGYRFGTEEVYCPWDVLNHCDKLLVNPKASPEAYWDNTSSNQMVRRFIDLADVAAREDIERLIAGESVAKHLHKTLTYGDLDEDVEHLWSVLYLTGYLTLDREAEAAEDGLTRLVIPNREVCEIFVEKIRKWFSETVKPAAHNRLCELIWERDAKVLEEEIGNILLDTISYYDYHENYYHALLAGVFLGGNLLVRSNYEMGKGRSDIVVEDAKKRRAVIIETKRSADYDDLERDARRALAQIREKKHAWPYERRKYQVIRYGISFSEKDCCVRTDDTAYQM